MSSPCPEGYVCGSRTDAASQFDIKCPAGYVCQFGTTPTTQFDYLCEPGFGCPAGTSWNTRTQLRCAAGYYCPEGSTSANPLVTKCPIGTTSAEGAKSVEECVRECDVVDSCPSICRISPYFNGTFDPCLLKMKCWKTSPEDEAKQELCFQKGQAEARADFFSDIQDPKLKDTHFHKVEAFSVAHVKLDFRNLPLPMKYLEHYEIALYYFNKTQPIKVHKVYDECPYLTPTPNYFRNLPVCSEFDGTWFGSPLVDKHGIMEFSISSHREVYFRVEIEMFHGQYLENKNYTAFFGTMSIDFSYPSRAEYFERFEDVSVYSAASLETRPDPREVRLDTDCVVERDGVTRPCSKTFLATIDASNQDLNVALNVEVPYLPTSGNAQYWNFQTMPWIDFASTDPSIPLLSQPFVSSVGTSTKGVGKTMDQAYPPLWTEDPDPFGPFGYVGTGDNEMVVLPYLPFFSSCRGFDSHIFLYRLFEEQSIPNVEGGCNLTESWKTQHIREFDPFNNPSKADLLSTAVDVCRWQFECTFEEQLDKAPLPKRWYSQDPGETLFSITRDAFNENEFREIGRFKSFENTDRLVEAVIRTPDLLYDDELLAQGVPRQVILLVQFYQKSPTMKRIINVEVGLELYEIVEDPEAPGASDYSLEVFFQAMTWTELLNEFAFDVRVYAVFFIIVGLLVILFSAVFWAFHRLFTRLSQPPAFRFRSYAYLTAIPPVQGFILACLPWLAVILLLDILYNQVDILDWQKNHLRVFRQSDCHFQGKRKGYTNCCQGWQVRRWVVCGLVLWSVYLCRDVHSTQRRRGDRGAWHQHRKFEKIQNLEPNVLA
mmetsp:Transcript_18218/g.43885  ORF Transcript_18218/g.43885 Transcript_18218/m.43885 type:complete len:827 (+) Transcript_18218:3-2483(+)